MTKLAREFDTGNALPIPVLPWGPAQQVALTSSASAASTVFGATTTVVTVWATVDFYLATGANPTAGTTGFAVRADTMIDIPVISGVTKIAARGMTAAGTLFISERV